MAFDITTAKPIGAPPVEKKTGGTVGGFDITTAKPFAPVEVPEEAPGYMDNIKADFNKRKVEFAELEAEIDAKKVPQQGKEAMLIANSAVNLLGAGWNAVSSGVGELYKMTPPETQKMVGEAIEWLGEGVRSQFDSPHGRMWIKAATKGDEQYQKMKKAHPFETARLEDTLILATVASPKVGPDNFKWLDEVLTPYPRKSVKKKARRQREVKAGFVHTKLNKEQLAAKQELKTVPGVKPTSITHPNQANADAVYKEIGKTAQKLQFDLADANILINEKELNTSLNAGMRRIVNKYPELRGSKRLLDEIDKTKLYIDKYRLPDGTIKADGLYQARKELNQRFSDLKGDRRAQGLSNPTLEEMAWRSSQKSVAQLLEVKAPDAKTLKSLKRQSSLYDALDIIDDKADYDRATPMGRAWDKIKGGSERVGVQLRPR